MAASAKTRRLQHDLNSTNDSPRQSKILSMSGLRRCFFCDESHPRYYYYCSRWRKDDLTENCLICRIKPKLLKISRKDADRNFSERTQKEINRLTDEWRNGVMETGYFISQEELKKVRDILNAERLRPGSRKSGIIRRRQIPGLFAQPFWLDDKRKIARKDSTPLDSVDAHNRSLSIDKVTEPLNPNDQNKSVPETTREKAHSKLWTQNSKVNTISEPEDITMPLTEAPSSSASTTLAAKRVIGAGANDKAVGEVAETTADGVSEDIVNGKPSESSAPLELDYGSNCTLSESIQRLLVQTSASVKVLESLLESPCELPAHDEQILMADIATVYKVQEFALTSYKHTENLRNIALEGQRLQDQRSRLFGDLRFK